jgi:ABC-2 type transport system ATP-binding protein
MSQAALVFEKVTRRFGRRTALNELDLAVQPGTVLGLVGRNGAGKTTSLRMAHGLLFPDAGRIRVLGLDPVAQGLELRTRVSLLSEESALYTWMKVGQLIGFAAALHPRWDAALATRLIERLELEPEEKIAALSRGTRAKVALVVAVACRPELLLLDDPTAGLDPLVRREVLQGILEATCDEGGAVVYASHLVHDIERVADRVAVLDRGSVLLEDSLEELKRRIHHARAVFESDPPAGASLSGAIHHEADGRVLSVVAACPAPELEAGLRGLGAKSVECGQLPLEEILVAYLRRGGHGEADHV